jgi:hypothetical protein
MEEKFEEFVDGREQVRRHEQGTEGGCDEKTGGAEAMGRWFRGGRRDGHGME